MIDVNGPAIRVENLKKSFTVREKGEGMLEGIGRLLKPSLRTVDAVNGINFNVQKGETLAFIGPNGAGKSTTIKILTGILHPTSGDARVLGYTPWSDREKLAYSIGSVFGQKSQLWYHLPPIDSFSLLSKIYEMPKDIYRSRLAELVDIFEISDLMKTPVRKMSLGQRMRCEIAGSLIHGPEILFLDEPTIGLDVIAKQKIRDLITRLNKEKELTVFLTSHDAGDIEKLCKRVIIVNFGQIVLDTEVSTLKREYMRRKVINLRMERDIDVSGFTTIPGIQLEKHKGAGIKLAIDTQTVGVSQALSTVMSSGSIEDITISDPPLEEIISDIYRSTRKGDLLRHGTYDSENPQIR